MKMFGTLVFPKSKLTTIKGNAQTRARARSGLRMAERVMYWPRFGSNLFFAAKRMLWRGGAQSAPKISFYVTM
jgi:hypothetical protein